MKKVYKALTIAGSDSGGGAGIQADLKTFAAFGVYGTCVITAVTAQNTIGITRIAELSPDMVGAQFDAVIQDIGTHAVKTGMLYNSGIIEVVAEKIHQYRLQNIVVDPVLFATEGKVLLQTEAIETLRSRLIPLAAVVAPNIPEAEQLTGFRIRNLQEIKSAAKKILAMGARTVIVKGGHRRGPATDIFYNGKKFTAFKCRRIETRHTHGTGCTFSAAIAANLAKGKELEEAVAAAKKYTTEALRRGFAVGSGHSPVHHFYGFWEKGRG